MSSPTDLEPRVSDALARGAARVEPPEPDWDALVGAVRRRRHTRVASAVIAAVLVVAIAIGIAASSVGGGNSGIAPATRPRGGAVTPTTPPNPSIVTPDSIDSILDQYPMRTPPAGWQVVDYHGFRQFVPPSWTVQTKGCPTGEPKTLTLGAPQGRVCNTPSTKEPWIWLRPLDPTMDSMARSCGPGFFNKVPGCQYLDRSSKRPAEVWFLEGLDVALITSHGTSPAAFSEITDSWQYTDPNRPEAAGSRSYQMPQPLFIAIDYLARYLEGNCDVLKGYADRDFVPACPPPDPTTLVRGGESSSTGGAVTTQKERVNLYDGRVFEVELRNQYSLTTNRVESRVTAVSQIDPNTPKDFTPPGTPDCVPVSGHDGKIAGCTPKQFLFPGSGGPQEFDAQYPDGPPVYARAGSDKIVGYFVNSLGFVPNRLMERIEELRSCEQALTNAPNQPAEPLTTSCRRLLRDWGVSKKALHVK
jgi:hypothetical protein